MKMNDSALETRQEYHRDYSRNHYQRNKERIKVIRAKYYQDNRDGVLLKAQGVRDRLGPKHGSNSGLKRGNLRVLEVFERDGNKCVACGTAEGLHLHHIDGDAENNEIQNMEVRCNSCHMSHHASQRLGVLNGNWKGDEATPRSKRKRKYGRRK